MLPQPVLTQQGLALIAKTPIGSPLHLTGWQVGSGAMSTGQDPSKATAMLQPVYSTSISSTQATDNQCQVLGQFVNTGLSGFPWEETGLFATDPDLGTILFAYGNSFGQGELIPAGSSGLREVVFGANLIFSNTPNVTAVIDQGLIFITISQKGKPGGVATLDENGKVPENQLPWVDLDCGVWDVEPVAAHNAAAASHQNMIVDGNNTAAVHTSSTLEEHMADPSAHQNLLIDGNLA